LTLYHKVICIPPNVGTDAESARPRCERNLLDQRWCGRWESYSSSTRDLPRPPFTAARSFFAVSRRSFTARPGLVSVRVLGRTAACRMRATRRARAAARFCACVRCSRLSSTSTPAVVIRPPAIALRRDLTYGGSDEAPTLKRNSTAVATLFTFCPPGPDARTNRSSISRSSPASVLLVGIKDSGTSAVLIPSSLRAGCCRSRSDGSCTATFHLP